MSSNKFGFDCGASTLHAVDRIGVAADTLRPGFKFGPTVVRLTQFANVECGLSGVLPATERTKANENKNKIKYENVPIINPQTEAQIQHLTASVIDRNDKAVTISKESREFDDIACILNGNMDSIGLQYDTLSGMFIFIFIFIFVFNCVVVKC